MPFILSFKHCVINMMKLLLRDIVTDVEWQIDNGRIGAHFERLKSRCPTVVVVNKNYISINYPTRVSP